MVNVAGRSKGCTNCRKRRVKCDEHQPVCQRCKRAGLECDGPGGIAIIQDRRSLSLRSQKTTKSVATKQRGEQASDIVVLTPVTFAKPSNSDIELSICFVRQFFPTVGPLAAMQRRLGAADVDSVEKNIQSTSVSTTAFIGCSLLVYGARYRQPSITRKGLVLQSITLQKLNAALSDHRTRTKDEVILSVIVLATLEAVLPMRQGSYLEHMMGLQRLLALRDPQDRGSQDECSIYKSVRHMVIFASLRAQRPTVFAQANWKALLRAHCSDDEMWEQELFEVLADCTVLLDRRRRLNIGELHQTSGLADIEADAAMLLNRLRNWRGRWDERNTYSYTAATPMLEGLQRVLNDSGLAPASFPPLRALHFADPLDCAVLLLYDATVLSVLRLVESVEAINGGEKPAADPDALHEHARCSSPGGSDALKERLAALRLSAALEICCCIPFCSRPGAGSGRGASPNIHWAATMAWDSFGHDQSALGRWMSETLRSKDGWVIAPGLWDK